mgnify:FL=1
MNDTKIFLPDKYLDDTITSIVNKFSNSDVFNHIRVMPDCHGSAYCCVGLTSVITDKVVPQIVGGDIGCGISCYPLNKVIKEKHYKKIDETVKSIIPMGEKIHRNSIATDVVLNNIYDECNKKLVFLKSRFTDYPFNDFQYNQNYYQSLIKKLKSKINSAVFLRSLGTLGGGNHYVEFNQDLDGKCYLCVHSGSRAIGLAICGYHQLKAKNNMKGKTLLENYLEKHELVEYLIDMVFAQEFASKNRELIIQQICNEIGVDYDTKNLIETIHNYIDFDRLILRKGAIAAEAGKKCIISLNMRDGVLLCKGKGNEDWNYSSAHGCGRMMSRADAKKSFSMSQFKNSMKDVYSTSVCKETLDESPMAYKDVELIKEYIGESVDIITQLKPIINIKGY